MGSVILGSPGWVWVVVTLAAAFGVLLLVAALRSPLTGRWTIGLSALKAMAVVLLTLCLLDPLLTRAHVKPGENIVLLVADDSASLTIRESASDPRTRGETFKNLLTDPESPWQIRLAQDFDVRRYTFGASVSRVEGFQNLNFESPASNLNGALSALFRRFDKQPLAAVLLMTDGNSTDSLQVGSLPGSLPIFPVLSDDSRSPQPDLSIGAVSVSQTNFEDAPVSVQARIAGSGDFSGRIRVMLEPYPATDESGSDRKSVPDTPSDPDTEQRQTITLAPQDDQDVVARFQVKPPRPGVLFYRLRVVPDENSQVFDKPELSREATLANNERLIAVNRDAHVFRILYVGGRPNWERKFLGRALEEDDRLQLVSLVRIARKEARFDFRGRVGESSNPLFRGFKEEVDEETESYNQPVLVRMNVRDNSELSDGFPKAKAELYRYDAVILDDIESAFFTRDQLSLLDKFVSERGGGLLMLGGRDTFQHGKWDNTPIADALPVYLDRTGDRLTAPLHWQLTREGLLEPWMRVRDTEQAEQRRLENAPPVSMLNNTPDVKPGARILAEVEDESGRKSPALVAQQYGRGRAGAVLIGDLWKWSLQQEHPEDDDPGKTWRQIVRWLVGDVPKRVEVRVQAASDTTSVPDTGSVRDTELAGSMGTSIQVRVRDREFQPQEGARVNVTVIQPDGTEVRLEAQPSLQQSGLFEAQHVSRVAGAYVARIEVPGSEDGPVQNAEIGWTSEPAADEFKRTAVNVKLLEQLAHQTGGNVVPLDRLNDFVAGLAYRDLPKMESEATPLWHRPWLLLAVLALLASEWGLRRWRGLA